MSDADRAPMSAAASPTVARVLRGQLCTGCGLCAGVSDGAITLGTTPPGYTRPIQQRPVSDVAERAIAAACPGAIVAAWPAEPKPNPYWGPAREVATGHATDAEVRFLGSSGGVLSALALAALDTGLADAVLHVGADPDQPTRNVIRWSTSRAEVLDGAGSRYAASSPLGDIDARLSAGKRFVFIGKPCDVSALRQLATVDPRVDRLVPLMLSFFCGGIPSHAGSDRIIRAMGLEPEEVTAFRYRGNGWPGRARAETADGRIGDMSYHDSWGGHLSKEVQFRCKICPDAVGGVADIAAGDAWYGGETGYPLFDEAEGRSLILARTAAGEAFLGQIRTAGVIETAPLDIDEIELMQFSQARRKRLIAARTAACLATAQPRPKMRGLQVAAAARRAPPAEALKNFLGTLRRIVINRR